MNNLEIKHVDFMGDDLIAVKTEDSTVYAGVSHICNGIGMSKNQKDWQVKVIQKDAVLSKGCGEFSAPSEGGLQVALFLQLDYVPLWLAKVNVTPKMLEEAPELAEKLINYQLKVKDILAAAFLHKAAPAPTVVHVDPEFMPHFGEVDKFLRTTIRVMEKMGRSPFEIGAVFKGVAAQAGVCLPEGFDRIPADRYAGGETIQITVPGFND